VASLLAEMETATTNIEHEIAGIDQEAAKILAHRIEMSQNLRSLLINTSNFMLDISGSRLHFSQETLQGPAGTAEDMASEAIKGLQNLEDVCYKSSTS
jgi:centromere-localized protein 2